MSESQEYLGPRLSTDQKKFNNLMLELSVDFLILEKLEINISPTLSNVKILLLALFYLGVLPKMFSMKCKETFMIVLAFLKTFTPILDYCQEEEPQKCRFHPESTKKLANTKELSNYPLEQVIIFLCVVGYAL